MGKKFMIEKSVVEKFVFVLGLKSPGLKGCGVEKFMVETSWVEKYGVEKLLLSLGLKGLG